MIRISSLHVEITLNAASKADVLICAEALAAAHHEDVKIWGYGIKPIVITAPTYAL